MVEQLAKVSLMDYNSAQDRYSIPDIEYALAIDALRCKVLSSNPSQPLEEARQLEALWRKTDELDDRSRNNSERIKIIEGRVEHFVERESEHYGQIKESLKTLTEVVEKLNQRMLTIEIRGETKTGLFDRWAPTIISFVGVCVAAWAVSQGGGGG